MPSFFRTTLCILLGSIVPTLALADASNCTATPAHYELAIRFEHKVKPGEDIYQLLQTDLSGVQKLASQYQLQPEHLNIQDFSIDKNKKSIPPERMNIRDFSTDKSKKSMSKETLYELNATAGLQLPYNDQVLEMFNDKSKLNNVSVRMVPANACDRDAQKKNGPQEYSISILFDTEKTSRPPQQHLQEKNAFIEQLAQKNQWPQFEFTGQTLVLDLEGKTGSPPKNSLFISLGFKMEAQPQAA